MKLCSSLAATYRWNEITKVTIRHKYIKTASVEYWHICIEPSLHDLINRWFSFNITKLFQVVNCLHSWFKSNLNLKDIEQDSHRASPSLLNNNYKTKWKKKQRSLIWEYYPEHNVCVIEATWWLTFETWMNRKVVASIETTCQLIISTYIPA